MISYKHNEAFPNEGFYPQSKGIESFINKLKNDKKAEIVPNLTFQKFEETLHNNGLFVDLNEMLTRYKVQGVCVNLCHQLLENHYLFRAS